MTIQVSFDTGELYQVETGPDECGYFWKLSRWDGIGKFLLLSTGGGYGCNKSAATQAVSFIPF